MTDLLQDILHKMRIVNKLADRRFKAMADQIVQVFETITYSLVFLIIIMMFDHFHTGNKQKEDKKDEIGDLKLEAQRVREFDENLATWQKWKIKTECAFNGSGYKRILSS